jgi:phospholipid transport system substrate-binding protein
MKNFLRNFAVIAVIALFILPSLSAASEATDQLKHSIDGIIEILNDPALKAPAKKKARRDKIRLRIQERFSFEDMAKRALGKHWKKRSDAEKSEFVKVFGTLIENSYIGKLEAYTNEVVLYGEEINKKRVIEVRTKIVTARDTEIPINYRLLSRNGQWMVYDVIVEGVSLVRNYRTQFNQALRSAPFKDLIAKLEKKIAAE